MDKFLEAQLIMHTRISNAYQNFKAKGQEKMTRGNAEGRLAGLEKDYSKATEIHAAVMESKHRDLQHDYFKTNLMERLIDSYYDRKGEFLDFLRPLAENDKEVATQKSSGDTAATVAQPQISLSSLLQSLPKIDVPNFSGRYSEWPNFRDMFRALIHRRDDMAPVIKLYYLRSHLQGAALEQIESIALTDENYDKVWSDLLDYYENQRRLINNCLSNLFAVKPMKNESAAELKRLVKETTNPLESLKALGRPTSQWSDLIVFMTTGRLDPVTRRDWEKELGETTAFPTHEKLIAFLKAQTLTLESIESATKGSTSSPTKSQAPQGKPKEGASQSAHAAQVKPKPQDKASSAKCVLCAQSHYLGACPDFKAKSVSDRKAVVMEKKACFNCLGSHHFKACRSKYTCSQCQGKHHTLLHFGKPKENSASASSASTEKTADQASNSQPSASASPDLNSNHLNCSVAKVSSPIGAGILLATARVYVSSPAGEKIPARALIDNCSQSSFMSESLCQILKIKTKSVHIPISGVGGNTSATCRKLARLTISPHFQSKFTFDVNALVIQNVSVYSPPKFCGKTQMSHIKNLELADPRYMDPSRIDLLLGADIHAQIMQSGIARGDPGEPIASCSLLGWLLSGPVSTPAKSITSNSVAIQGTEDLNFHDLTALHCAEEAKLLDLVQDFWRQEELPAEKFYTPDEKKCEEHFTQTHRRDASGRYVVRLPFKNPVQDLELGDSYSRAVRMLHQMERKSRSNKDFQAHYSNFMEDYLQQGHMVLVSPDSSLYKPPEKCIFLQHHGILTSKFRTVFNGSGKSDKNISLNQLLYAGPNLLPELPNLVCVWRTYKFVFTTDIKQMFRMIQVDERDQPFLAIVWRSNPDDPIAVYFLVTVTYGLVCSPYLASRTLRQLATDHRAQYPLGAVMIEEECYMDDVLSGAHTLEEALKKQAQLINLLKEGGFSLRKWLANDVALLDHLPPDHLALSSQSLFDSSSSTPVLGLQWQTSEDAFTFKVNYLPITGKITKRIVLSRIAQIFDPMGWLAPVVVTAKIFMQSLWLLKSSWDDDLPEELSVKWNTWVSKLVAINSIRIPRFTQWSPDASLVEIHGFADASSRAYGAAVYLRVVVRNQAFVTLQIAKTKVAPLKTKSIPRLELCAAQLLARMVHHYCSIMPIGIESVHLWTDSRDVLCWLRDHPARWEVYVANRCADIQTLLPNAYWHHVRSAENPADVASRGIPPDLLGDFSQWWHGPGWLTASLHPWPTELDNLSLHKPAEDKASRNLSALNACDEGAEPGFLDLSKRYSHLGKLLRVTAYVMRYLLKLCRRASVNNVNSNYKIFSHKFLDTSEVHSSPELHLSELENARLLWVFLHQRYYFAKEIAVLQKSAQKTPALKGALLKLQPMLDKDLLRVGGRLNRGLMDPDCKNPLILPGDSFLSQLIIRKIHILTLHGGTQLTLGTVRRQYWLLNGRNAVKKIIHTCSQCVRYAASFRPQVMGDLPQSRISMAPPFSRSGVDYAGPINVRLTKSRGKGTMKAYICLFVCLSVRAVHLELVEDYTTESFIAAFHRFTSRRGHCFELVSDCGTNFVGADAELRKMYKEASQHSFKVAQTLSELGTSWKFNPPGAPHFGGIWESAVKSTKHHLHRVIGENILTFSELSTLLCRIEACLNSRPLMPLTDDPSDLEYLSPARILLLRDSYLVPEPDLTNTKVPIGRRWQMVSKMAQDFWSRWSSEYLTSLQPRPKWNLPIRSFQVGDLVLIRNELSPPGKWPLARVIKTHPDPKGVNRVCTLRTAASTLQRPSHKLILLTPGIENPPTVPTPSRT